MHNHADETPFDAPELMSGYPLDTGERAALQAAIEAVAVLARQPRIEQPIKRTATPFEMPLN